MFRFICIEITSVNQTDVRSWAELKADFIVNFVERRRKHTFLMVLCSIDNKTTRLTFPPPPPTFFWCRSCATGQSLYPAEMISHKCLAKQGRVIDDQYIERWRSISKL